MNVQLFLYCLLKRLSLFLWITCTFVKNQAVMLTWVFLWTPVLLCVHPFANTAPSQLLEQLNYSFQNCFPYCAGNLTGIVYQHSDWFGEIWGLHPAFQPLNVVRLLLWWLHLGNQSSSHFLLTLVFSEGLGCECSLIVWMGPPKRRVRPEW